MWPSNSLVPNTIITYKARRLMVVWEYTRGMAEDDREFESRMEMKLQAYHWVLVYLRHKFPDYKVHFQAVVMGILTLVRQGGFDKQMELLGIDNKGRGEVGKAVAVAAVKANGDVLRQRREKLGEIGFGGG